MKRAYKDFYDKKKKHKGEKILRNSTVEDCNEFGDSFGLLTLPNDSEAALLLLRSIFDVEKFSHKIPPISFIHQVYSIVKCKTIVDREVNTLQDLGKVRLLRLGCEENSMAVVFTSDLQECVTKHYSPSKPVKHFVNAILPEIRDVSIDKATLRQKYNLSEYDIREVVSAGLLTIRCAISYWFAVPSAGEFMKAFISGRKAMLRTVRKSKYSEILKSELEKRPLEKSVKLSIAYHVHDIIGADLVKCIETSSGTILRFVYQDWKRPGRRRL